MKIFRDGLRARRQTIQEERREEETYVILDVVSLELLLGLTDPSDLRVGVDDGGDSVVVHMSMARSDVFHCGNTYQRRMIKIS